MVLILMLGILVGIANQIGFRANSYLLFSRKTEKREVGFSK